MIPEVELKNIFFAFCGTSYDWDFHRLQRRTGNSGIRRNGLRVNGGKEGLVKSRNEPGNVEPVRYVPDGKSGIIGSNA